MSGPRFLDVGNCAADRAALRAILQRHFDAEVVAVREGGEALQRLQAAEFQLVLVNRVLDYDGSLGLDVIRAMKSHPQLASVPVMMITNYPEHQQQALALGALPGFGKRDLGSNEMLELIRNALPSLA